MTNLTIKSMKSFVTGAFLMGSIALTGCVTTGTSSSNSPIGVSEVTVEMASTVENSQLSNFSKKAYVSRTGEAYLMRGLANVFSRGMDTMAEKLRAKGVDAVSFNHSHWEPIAKDIVARAKIGNVSYPIVIMGHSLGGNQSSKFANYFASRGVNVDLVVAFDPTLTGYVGKNIDTVINYYLPKNEDNRIFASAGFDGKLSNIDLSGNNEITHTNVEKNARFQANSINSVISITKAL